MTESYMSLFPTLSPFFSITYNLDKINRNTKNKNGVYGTYGEVTTQKLFPRKKVLKKNLKLSLKSIVRSSFGNIIYITKSVRFNIYI